MGRLLREWHEVQLPGGCDRVAEDGGRHVHPRRRPRVRPSRAHRTRRRLPIPRGEGWPRAQRGTVLREDPARVRRADDRRSVRVPGLWHEVGAAHGAAARTAGPGVREVRARGAPHGPAGPHSSISRTHFGVFATARITRIAPDLERPSGLSPVRYATGRTAPYRWRTRPVNSCVPYKAAAAVGLAVMGSSRAGVAVNRRLRLGVTATGVAFVIAVIFGATGALVPAGQVAAFGASTLTIISGPVAVRHAGGDFASANDGAVLAEGDTVKTGVDARAVLTYFEGSTVEMEPDSEVTIDSAYSAPDGSTIIVMQQNLGITW